jgi:1,4-alpha-glucan branching enzyme
MGVKGAAAERATRELLALQASDWAFLDRRRQAGDYPWQRTTEHAEALLESINSGDHPPVARLRNLAPDLRLTPLLEP